MYYFRKFLLLKRIKGNYPVLKVWRDSVCLPSFITPLINPTLHGSRQIYEIFYPSDNVLDDLRAHGFGELSTIKYWEF